MNPIFFSHSMNCVNRKARRFVLVAGLIAAGACFSATSCGTAHGFGDDVKTADGRGVQHVGNKIEEKTER